MSFSCLSQFFILNQRGNSIIRKDLRGDAPITTTETFYRNVKFYGGRPQSAPPIFLSDGITYLYIKNNGLYFVATTKQCVSPSFIMELLTKITNIFNDYCGILTEETIKQNFILLLSLLDEILDFGYTQSISSEILKEFVFNEASIISSPSKKPKISILPTQKKDTKPAADANRRISLTGDPKKQKQEIFVDILENVSVTFNNKGHILSSSIDGTIKMKSFLSGSPRLELALNEDLVIDDCNFNESVCLDQFETAKILTFIPGDGEFNLLNYRKTNDFDPPYKIYPYFQMISPYKAELSVKIRADHIPYTHHGGNVCVEIPVPINCQTVTTELGINTIGQRAEFNRKNQKIIWKMKKFKGGTEQTIKISITFKEKQKSDIKKRIGPISVSFEIAQYKVSNLTVKYLRIMESYKKFNPHRWVRYITKSQSYICRL